MSKILFVASEVQPLTKTGGLADVAGALPPALKLLHNSVRIMMPAYQEILDRPIKRKLLSQIYIPGTPGKVELLETKLPQSGLKVILVNYAPAFGRPGNPYLNPHGEPWEDNAERFALLCRAAAMVALNNAGLNWQPDIVHCNDWQTGLIPALLSQTPTRPGTLFTIHNLAYQGLFSQETFLSLGLPSVFWQPYSLEFHNQLSFIKGGLVYSDRLSTVSPTYAEEIQSSEFGCGLEGLLSYRSNSLSGIVNGIDDQVWNPKTDTLIEHNYSHDNLSPKKLNKSDLQTNYALPVNSSEFLLGFIGRLVDQKGIDLICDIIPKLAAYPIQLVILGSGEAKHEKTLRQLAEKYPLRVAVRIGYDEALAHKIEAGADAFLMPSRYEPCGLNQLYSLRYGTLPIVNNVGGLSDTVVNNNTKGNAAEKTGFVFYETSGAALLKSIIDALDDFKRPARWKKIMQTAMNQNFSWDNSAKQYNRLYSEIIKARSSHNPSPSKKAKKAAKPPAK